MNGTKQLRSGAGLWAPKAGTISDNLPINKATGTRKFTGDLTFPDMLVGRALRSEVPHARLNSIDPRPALELPGVISVLTAQDIPGMNAVGKTVFDQEYLVTNHIRTVMDTLAIVAAETEQAAEAALEAIEVDLTPLSPVFDIESALATAAPKIHANGNLLLHFKIVLGDAQEGMKTADLIVEDTYEFPWIEHAFIEPEGVIAAPDPDGILTLWLGCHDVYTERAGLARAFGWSEDRFRVILVPAGGSFGGKDDNIIPVWAALLAHKTGYPVRFVFSRPESMRGHTKRHSMRIHHKLGAQSDGKLIAAHVEIVSDTGAYAHWGENIVRFAGLHSTGPYDVPNAFVDAKLVYTNNIAAGAMRGWGTPQVAFAVESQMDRLAEQLDLHPLRLRWLNALRDGDRMISGPLPLGCNYIDTLEMAAKRIGLDIDGAGR